MGNAQLWMQRCRSIFTCMFADKKKLTASNNLPGCLRHLYSTVPKKSLCNLRHHSTKRTKLMDRTVQKSGIPGSAGCVDHSRMIWHQIWSAKEERKDLHAVFLDAANMFGSVPHSFIWASFDFFRIPKTITNLIESYFATMFHLAGLYHCFELYGDMA